MLELNSEQVSLLEAHNALPQREERSLEQRLGHLGEEIRHIVSTVHRLKLQDLVALRLMHKMLTDIWNLALHDSIYDIMI